MLAEQQELLAQLRATGIATQIEKATGTRLPSLRDEEDRSAGGRKYHLAPPRYSPHPYSRIGWFIEIIMSPEDPDALLLDLSMRFPNAGVSLGLHRADMRFNVASFMVRGVQAGFVSPIPIDTKQRAIRVEEALRVGLTAPRFEPSRV